MATLAADGVFDPSGLSDAERAHLARYTGHMWLGRLLRRAARLRGAINIRRARRYAAVLRRNLDADILRAEGDLENILARLSGRVEVKR